MDSYRVDFTIDTGVTHDNHVIIIKAGTATDAEIKARSFLQSKLKHDESIDELSVTYLPVMVHVLYSSL